MATKSNVASTKSNVDSTMLPVASTLLLVWTGHKHTGRGAGGVTENAGVENVIRAKLQG